MAPLKPSAFTPEAVPQAAEDPLYGLRAKYRADKSEKKIDLGIGVYRGENAKPWVLPVVKKADNILRDTPDLDHEYLPIAGLEEFVSASQKLVFGLESPAIKEKRVVSFQSISGTGAMHIGAAFLSKFYRAKIRPSVYISSPTWANHIPIFNTAKIPIEEYPYFSEKSRGINFEGMLTTIKAAPEGSIILLHACAHNPTGVDPSQAQWMQLADAMQRKSHLPFFDCAYQGFASGNVEKDAWAVRHFVERGFEVLVAQSYAKNFGLYGERIGCFHFVTSPGPDAESVARRVTSQISILQRSEISNPPAYGARLVSLVLNDPILYSEWEENLKTMSGRIISIRRSLLEKLQELGTPGDWNYITEQIGMFTLINLPRRQIIRLRETFHIYMMETGRMAMAGLNLSNIDHFARSVDTVVRDCL